MSDEQLTDELQRDAALIDWLQREVTKAHVSCTFWCCIACASSAATLALSLAIFFLVSK